MEHSFCDTCFFNINNDNNAQFSIENIQAYYDTGKAWKGPFQHLQFSIIYRAIMYNAQILTIEYFSCFSRAFFNGV